jgi:glycosyltransferase involved in cell wall biosynthesis
VTVSNPPLVSVIVPAFNAERFLPEAVASVLGQTFEDLELLIVNDGSSDGTLALAERSAEEDERVHVLDRPNGGPSAARNAGIAAARGQLVCFLDADDVLLPDKLERQVAFLRTFPSCDLVYSDFYLGDESLSPILLRSLAPPAVPMNELFSYSCWFAPMSPLVRAACVARAGPFDEGLRSSEDWDFWIRVSRCGKLGYLPGPVGVYRLHATQAHHDVARIRDTSERLIRKHFAPDSLEWHNAHAAMAWSYAKRQRAAGEYAATAVNLVRVAWHVRSLRTLKNVFSLANF